MGKAVKLGAVWWLGAPSGLPRVPECWLPVGLDCHVFLWTLACVTYQVAHVHHFLDRNCPVWKPSATGEAEMCPEGQNARGYFKGIV